MPNSKAKAVRKKHHKHVKTAKKRARAMRENKKK